MSSYNIHVVYTRNPDTDTDSFYTTKLNQKPSDEDFPSLEKEELNIMDKEDVPQLEAGGGGAPKTSKGGKSDEKSGDDKDEKSGDKG